MRFVNGPLDGWDFRPFARGPVSATLLGMPAEHTVTSRAVESEAGDGGPSADLDAALRALHAASIHLAEASRGMVEPLVSKAGLLVREATTLVTTATRLHNSS